MKHNRFYWFLQLAGRLNYYKGIDKLSFLDWLYQRRIGFKTALDVGRIFNPKTKQNDNNKETT